MKRTVENPGRASGHHHSNPGSHRARRTEHAFTLLEVMAAVARIVGRPVPVQEADRRPGDPPELVADASAFCREFGWEPRHSDLDTIVSTAWKWLQAWKLGNRR